jgi:hypothetical protein
MDGTWDRGGQPIASFEMTAVGSNADTPSRG